jgi:hypothetical protein
VDHHQLAHNVTQDNVVKALINPASPFIALPNKLFKKIAKRWMDSFDADHQPTCGEDSCMVWQSCKHVGPLQNFGLKMGSLNETEEEDVIRRGTIHEIH